MDKHNLFEMIRIDFVVDENLKVYLMEANMSPNLSSSHFKQNKLYYEQLLYNLFGLVGVASRVERDSLRPLGNFTENMLSADRNIVTYAEMCQSEKCQTSCKSEECQLCLNCLTESEKKDLNNAYREYMNRGEMKRILPAPIDRTKGLDEKEYGNLTPRNQFMSKWFYGKCIMDSSWC